MQKTACLYLSYFSQNFDLNERDEDYFWRQQFFFAFFPLNKKLDDIDHRVPIFLAI